MNDELITRLVDKLETNPRRFDIPRTPPTPIPGVPIASPIVVHEEGDTVESLERFLDAPQRSRGHVAAARYEDMCALVTALDTESHARFYYTRAGEMRAILNDDVADVAGWRDWTIGYVPQFSESWAAWMKIQNALRSQIEVAEFIEERIKDFMRPAGAQMLELAQYFDVARSGKFVSGLRISSGEVQFAYEQQDKARGNIRIPTTVDLGMRVFEDMDAYKFPALFRYRIKDEVLSMAFKIENVQTIIDKAVADVVTRVGKMVGKRPLLMVTALPGATV